MKKNVKEGIKTGAYIVTQIGAGVLLGAAGGVLFRALPIGKVAKILAGIGWLGLTTKVSDVAAEGTVEYIESIEELIDTTKEKINKRNEGISA